MAEAITSSVIPFELESENQKVCHPSKNRHKIALKNGMNRNNSFVFIETVAFIPRFT